MKPGIAAVVLGALGLACSGCGCGGTPGLSETEALTASAPESSGPDRVLIGPAQQSLAASATEETAVILTFAHTGYLTRADLLLQAGATAGTVVLEVRPVVGQVPDATRLLASTALDGTTLPPAPGLVSVDLSPLNLAVTAGSTYALVLRSGTGTAGWWGTNSDWAPFAHAARRNRSSPGAPWGPWQALTSTDVCFQTWVSGS